MVDLPRENNDEYVHSLFEMVNSWNENGNVSWNSVDWDVVSTSVVKDESDFHCLKAKIHCFMRDHPKIVDQIQKHFFNEVIEHILKRSFRVKFTVNDSARMEILYRRFILEQDSNIRILLNYFFDDVQMLLITEKFENFPWPVRQAIIRLPKSVLVQLTMTWLNLMGAETLTRMFYENLLNPVGEQQQASLLSFLFDEKVFIFV